MRDDLNSVHVRRVLSPVSVATDAAQVGQIIDRQGFDSLTFVIATGSIADADATFAVTVDHGDQANLSDAAAVPASELVGTTGLAGFNFGDDDETRKLGYVGSKRYVRLTITPTGNTAAALMSAIALLGRPMFRPTANPPV
jgi:hypothetical protein